MCSFTCRGLRCGGTFFMPTPSPPMRAIFAGSVNAECRRRRGWCCGLEKPASAESTSTSQVRSLRLRLPACLRNLGVADQRQPAHVGEDVKGAGHSRRKKTKLASAMEPRAPRSLPPFRQWRGVEEVDPVNPGRGYTQN